VISGAVRIFVCTVPQDMRRSFDGLALAVRERLGQDPEGGSVFVFINRRANRLKALWFDQNGYCILYKRLHRALFRVPRATDEQLPIKQIDGTAFARLLRGVERPPPVKNWR
jgi:transposase